VIAQINTTQINPTSTLRTVKRERLGEGEVVFMKT